MAPAKLQRILHYAMCDTLGGVENLLAPLLGYRPAHGDYGHHLLVRGKHIHPYIRGPLSSSSASINYIKHAHGLRIPRRPRAFRHLHLGRILRQVEPDLILVWNLLNDRYFSRLNHGAAPLVYYEHAHAWYPVKENGPDCILSKVQMAICCSFAAQRLLQLRWEFDGPVSVCLNGLRPDMNLLDVKPRRIMANRAVRLGVAARHVSTKGLSLALHATAELVRRGYACELHIAGAGEEEQRLRTLCKSLRLGRVAIFHGLLAEMTGFYRDLDIYLCPSLSEPFGLVCLEAAAHGCPVVATRVDGIPEVIADGETGILVEPDLPLGDYPALGGSIRQLPPCVYNPSTDRIQSPKLPDPARIASAIAELIDDPERFNRMSIMAHRRATLEFGFTDYAERLLALLRNSGSMAAPPTLAAARGSASSSPLRVP